VNRIQHWHFAWFLTGLPGLAAQAAFDPSYQRNIPNASRQKSSMPQMDDPSACGSLETFGRHPSRFPMFRARNLNRCCRQVRLADRSVLAVEAGST